jgi:hypothetical protein
LTEKQGKVERKYRRNVKKCRRDKKCSPVWLDRQRVDGTFTAARYVSVEVSFRPEAVKNAPFVQSMGGANGELLLPGV